MRHLKAGRRLGVTTAHRKAMMRNMVTSILETGQVTTTLARAKEVRRPLEKMITFAKCGDLHARRMALRFVKSKLAMANLFDDLAERYADRPGGYCRIIKLATTRAGDASDMAIVQLIGSEQDTLTALKDAKKKKKPAKKSSMTLEKVSAEVKADEKPKVEQQAAEAVPDAAATAEAAPDAAAAKAEAPQEEQVAEAPVEESAPVTEVVSEESAPVAEVVSEESAPVTEVVSEESAPAEDAKPEAKS
jgi:large subunit ribosomal protein L17